MAGFLRVLRCAPGGIVLQSIENFAIQNFVAHSAFLIVFFFTSLMSRISGKHYSNESPQWLLTI